MFESLLSLLLAGTMSLASSVSGIGAQDAFDDSTLLSVAAIPEKSVEYVEPGYMSANSVMAIDLESHTALYERNSTAQVPIASLTKLMTAYIILSENDPNSVVTVSQNAAGTIGSSMRLYAGEQITIKSLLYGLLIESGNDAAVALAEYNAGSTEAFVNKMNEKAKELGMYETHYANTTGLDSSAAYSSAHDLALLSSYLVKDESIREIVRLPSTEVYSVDGHSHQLTSTNAILGELGIKGLKTGKTPSAGECLISFAQSPDGHEIITVVLGSGNRFSDSRTLIDWIYRAYTWQ